MEQAKEWIIKAFRFVRGFFKPVIEGAKRVVIGLIEAVSSLARKLIRWINENVGRILNMFAEACVKEFAKKGVDGVLETVGNYMFQY